MANCYDYFALARQEAVWHNNLSEQQLTGLLARRHNNLQGSDAFPSRKTISFLSDRTNE